MTDPKRLLAGDATEFERLLLGAAIREQPSHRQRRRMMRALVLAELGILTTSAKAIASWASHVVVVAVVAASIAGTGSSPASPLAATRRSAEKVEQQLPPPAALPTPEVSSPTSVDVSVEDLPLVADLPPDSKTASRPRAELPGKRSPDLREEIALMDQARTALRSGVPSRALSTINQYRTRFPRGSFGQEAAVLRVEALAASGNRSRAVAEAKRFLAAQPNSPHAERLRLVISGSASHSH